jgi:hypothetical protein
MKKLAGALVLLVIAVGGWWYASPLWTLRQMREAATSGDADKISRYVDYPAVREDLKSEFRRSMMSEITKDQGNGFAMLGSAFALALIDPMIDAMVTPEGVEAMFDQAKRERLPDKGPKMPQASSDPIVDRIGFDEFIVRDSDPKKGSLVFQRAGLGWKLVGFEMPPEALANGSEVKI